ncbi:MAG: multidrug transporter [Rhodocyclales bacterium GT-UBC]|nr:MAG: multidrug transporter [Rhodocyclales bacterium GT-UBC]
MKWLILILGIVTNASASILIKLATMPPRRFPSITAPLSALDNGPFWAGLGLYGAAFLLYAAALERLPLNVAHPILTAGAIGAVAVCSVLIFHEPFHWLRALGVLLVVIGVVLITAQTTS